MSTIKESRNYNQFELLAFNRDVKKTTELERTMGLFGWIDAYPMHVVQHNGKKLKIKAGHHRFTVARKLGIPVKYVICEDLGESIHDLEKATNPWNMNDYLVSHLRTGKDAYKAVKKYRDETGISLTQCVSMLGGELASSCNKGPSFKNGTYRLGDLSNALTVSQLVKALKESGINFATNSWLVSALSKIAIADDFEIEIMAKKIKTNHYLVTKQANVIQYMDMLEQVYNHRSRTKVPLVFQANEAAKKRNICPYKV